MPTDLASVRHDLALANRILANEGVVDAFGHISVRHPDKPDRYLIARYLACELVQPDDIFEMTLDSQPVKPTNTRFYSELPIHGCIYQARPDVQAVCHHHSPSVLPYCLTGIELIPVVGLGGSIGKVPFWDSRDEFGDTNLLVTKPEEGHSLARALGQHAMVLMRRHGATVVGTSLQNCMFRSIYGCVNAEIQSRSMAMGTIAPLTQGEAELSGAHSGGRPAGRAWDYWAMRLQKAEGVWPAPGRRSKPKKAARGSRKRSAAKGKKPAARRGSDRLIGKRR